MRAVQFSFSGTVKEGGFCGFGADVYSCDVLFIKTDHAIFSDTLNKEVNLRMIFNIEDKLGGCRDESSWYVPVEHCDKEGMFKTIQSLIEQLKQIKKELSENNNPQGKFDDLCREIKFLEGIKRNDVWVAESAFFSG